MERSPRQAGGPEGAAYLCFHSEPERGGEWAALLVVNAGGLPQEFLYSGPLRPTPVQAILYQNQLDDQVRVSLVRSLLRGLRSRPAFFVAAAGDLTQAAASELRAPVLLLQDAEGRWLGDPSPAAEMTRRRLDESLGIAEPAGRARAALAYVVEYERTRSASS